MIHNQFGLKIKDFWSANAKEYLNQIKFLYFQKEEIIHEPACTNTLQQNGVVERKNGHLLATAKPCYFNKMFQNLIGERLYL